MLMSEYTRVQVISGYQQLLITLVDKGCISLLKIVVEKVAKGESIDYL
jgi:hypothetical protein